MSCPEPKDVARDLVQGSMGLAGIWRTAGNASAMLVLTVAFVLQLVWADRSAREDRALCREQLGQVREDFRAFRAENREQLQAIRKALLLWRREEREK